MIKLNLDPLEFGYLESENNELIIRKSDRIYPPVSELPPSCNCEKCTTMRCKCKSNFLNCCKFCNCMLKNTCMNMT